MAAVWKSVKENDIDKNGFMLCSELEDCFKEHYPAELEGKSLVFYFRKFSTDHDKNLINYRGIMKQIHTNSGIHQSESKSELRAITPQRSVLANLKTDPSSYRKMEELPPVAEEPPVASYQFDQGLKANKSMIISQNDRPSTLADAISKQQVIDRFRGGNMTPTLNREGQRRSAF